MQQLHEENDARKTLVLGGRKNSFDDKPSPLRPGLATSTSGGGGVLNERVSDSGERRRHSTRSPSSEDAAIRQELSKISKIQKEEVFGMDLHTVNRKAQVLERRKQASMRERFEATRKCLLQPQGRFRLWWDATSCALILFLAVALPYRSAFVDAWSLGWTLVDFLIDLFFLV
jgi:hypothetical protein